MTKEFVPYDLAIKLKELGFEEKCFCNWEESWSPEPEDEIRMVLTTDQTWLRPGWVCAPTFSQAFRWFRENYNLFHEINVDKTTEPKFAYTIIEYELAQFFEGFKEDVLAEYLYYKYEEAELACLDKLIEIVKLTKTTRTMTKEFVPYELAVKLKALGFEKECLAYYSIEKGFEKEFRYAITPYQLELLAQAPTLSQAFRWFRENHGLYQFISKEHLGFTYALLDEIYNFHTIHFKTYEEAEIACLEKLIEIVKLTKTTRTMKTAMQELRDDLVLTLETRNEALDEIKDKSIRESCQKVVQLTLESIIKRIDEELLEMEKEQKIDFALTVYSEIVETDKDFVDVIKSMNL